MKPMMNLNEMMEVFKTPQIISVRLEKEAMFRTSPLRLKNLSSIFIYHVMKAYN